MPSFFGAKLTSLASLVNVDIWQVRADAGPPLEKGSMRASTIITSSPASKQHG
jgi:hypothetical protein